MSKRRLRWHRPVRSRKHIAELRGGTKRPAVDPVKRYWRDSDGNVSSTPPPEAGS